MAVGIDRGLWYPPLYVIDEYISLTVPLHDACNLAMTLVGQTLRFISMPRIVRLLTSGGDVGEATEAVAVKWTGLLISRLLM